MYRHEQVKQHGGVDGDDDEQKQDDLFESSHQL